LQLAGTWLLVLLLVASGGDEPPGWGVLTFAACAGVGIQLPWYMFLFVCGYVWPAASCEYIVFMFAVVVKLAESVVCSFPWSL
jgi:hypothetical protein